MFFPEFDEPPGGGEPCACFQAEKVMRGGGSVRGGETPVPTILRVMGMVFNVKTTTTPVDVLAYSVLSMQST